MNPVVLGKFIAQLRNEKNLTQEELAEILFIDKRKISRWECGTSVPEFDMLIKLTDIFDITLYELSICQRINPSIKEKIIYKFKNIKDFHKYQLTKKIKYIFIFLLSVIFILLLIYFIKYNDSVTIYELTSLDNNYYIEGNYIKTKKYSTFTVNHIGLNNKENLNNCKYEIYDNDIRVFYIDNNSNTYHDSTNIIKNNKLSVNMICKNNKKTDTYKFNILLVNKYDNKLL